MHATRPLKILSAVVALALAGCEFEAPITENPTRPTNDKLVGTWKAIEGSDVMKVRQLDAATYVVSYNGDLYSAHHSDLGGTGRGDHQPALAEGDGPCGEGQLQGDGARQRALLAVGQDVASVVDGDQPEVIRQVGM